MKKYDNNPFEILGITSQLRNVDKKDVMIINEETGEVYNKKTKDYVAIDSLQYIKLFKGGLSFMKDLNTTEIKMLIFTLENIKPNRNYVLLDPKECLEYYGWNSLNNYYLGIRGLIDKNVLAKSSKDKNLYWFNSNLFYNGKRKIQ